MTCVCHAWVEIATYDMFAYPICNPEHDGDHIVLVQCLACEQRGFRKKRRLVIYTWRDDDAR